VPGRTWRCGATPRAVQELAGHRDLSTAQRYVHLSTAQQDTAIRLLDRRPAGESAGNRLETAPLAPKNGRETE